MASEVEKPRKHSEIPMSVEMDDEEAEAEFLREKLKNFYSANDKKRLAEGIEEIVDWTLRNGYDALNAKLKFKYGVDLESTTSAGENGEEDPKNLASEIQLSAEEKELIDTLQKFFAKMAPERPDRNYRIFVKYVRKKGRKALNNKLQKKYGVNLITFEDEAEDNESLPSILRDMPPVIATRPRPKVLSLSARSGQNPLDDRLDDLRRINMYERLSQFYSQYGKERMMKGIGNIVDWTLEHGEEKLNAKLRAKYGKDLTDIRESIVFKDPVPGELEKLPDAPKGKETQNVEGSRLSEKSGTNPATNVVDDAARLELSTRLTKFYSYFKVERLNKGIGDIVDWAIHHGEESLNEQLRGKYGHDLDSFEEKMRASEAEDKKARETEEVKAHVESKLQDVRERLIRFFKKYDPERADKSLDMLVRYIEAKGFKSMNEKLFAKYGADINTFEEAQEVETEFEKEAREKELERRSKKFLLPGWVKAALESYYVKYNQAYVNNGGVNTIYEWGLRNGMSALNKSLKDQYGESLDEFVDSTKTLREELVDFYKIAETSKDITEIEKVVAWGVKNGRAALNKKLRQKYRFDLDIAKEEYDDYESDEEKIF